MQRNLFEELPLEIGDYISPHASLSDVARLVSVSQSVNALFSHSLIQRQVLKLCEMVQQADYATAKKMMLTHSGLMLQEVKINGQSFSPLKLAYRKVDTAMGQIFLEAVKGSPDLQEAFFQQLNEPIEQEDFEFIFVAYEIFIREYARWCNSEISPDELDAAWLALGRQQRLLPQHILKEFCREGSWWGVGSAFNNMTPPMSPGIAILTGETWVSSYPALVFGDNETYTLMRGEWHGGVGSFVISYQALSKTDWIDGEPWREDLAILRHLCTVRKNAFEQLKDPTIALAPEPGWLSWCNII